jgi:hypothetical protein
VTGQRKNDTTRTGRPTGTRREDDADEDCLE